MVPDLLMLQTCIKNRLIRRGIVALALLAVLPGCTTNGGTTDERRSSTPVVAEQTFDEAVAAYERGDYDTAMQGFRVHAEQGNAEAQLNLGVMYANSLGVPEDDAEAVRWYRLAADQGLAGAQLNLGLMYAKGEGVLKDEAEAVRWYRLAADQGDAGAQFILGVKYASGEGVLKDSVLAHMWLNIAGANGNEVAREWRDNFERDMTRVEISRATELARECMASDYQDCEP